MNLRLPKGISNFKELRTIDADTNPYTFVDKSLLIRDVIDDTQVLLFTRPRRFGKTLSLSMLYYFFSCTEEGTADLFNGLKIADNKDFCAKHQGQYPTIFITFKDVRPRGYEAAYRKIAGIIAECYRRFKYLTTVKDLLDKDEQEFFSRITAEKAEQQDLESSLKKLSRWLQKHHGKNVVILIDEYDTPIHAAYFNGYYDDMIPLMREILGSALKDNDYLYKGIVTGILRVAREDIFSGLNNPEVYTFLDRAYGEYFGFTEDEVEALFKSLPAVDLADVKAWYNGYQANDLVLYNPWSILSCLKSGGELIPYWVNVSDNALIYDLLTGAGPSIGIQEEFTTLMQGEEITTSLDPHLNLRDLTRDTTTILSLLYMSGYLNATSEVYDSIAYRMRYTLRIPNKEVHSLYANIIEKWLSHGQKNDWLFQCLEDMKAGRMANFENNLQQIADSIFSYHDVKGRTPESFFHGFLLGLVLYCKHEYTISSNREAGNGRYDIELLPNNAAPDLHGIIFEIKSLPKKASEKQLMAAAEDALKQIEEKKYQRMQEAEHVKKWLYLGVAFSGKALKLAHKIMAGKAVEQRDEIG
jgi:hypothetical protein